MRHASRRPSPRQLAHTVAVALALALAVPAGACDDAGIGDRCVPARESDPAFRGFAETEVSVDSRSMECRSRVCLVDHFRGRVTDAPDAVPRCSRRSVDDAVYCSCRCANAAGRTDDGAPYCACPAGFECAALVAPTGLRDEGLTGSYCIRTGTAYVATDCP